MLVHGKGDCDALEATSIDESLDELSDARRPQIEAVRQVILANLPEGYQEVIAWRMIAYEVPLDVYRDTTTASR